MREIEVTTKDGRRLAVTEIGDPDAVPVFFHHGTPGNRAAHNRSPDALAGSRAIFYDRPGYGGSDRQLGRSVGDCAADVASIADLLEIEQFAVLGSSGGGPHALACAALLHDRVTRLAVMAGFAPIDDPEFDAFAGMSEGNIAEFNAALDGEDALRQALEQEIEATGGDPEVILDSIASELAKPDQRALARADIRAVFADAIAASVRSGLDGWIDDDLAFTRPWGFALSGIDQEALLLQGEHDRLVPRPHMDYIAHELPRAELAVVDGEGHTLFDKTADVVRWLIA